MEIKYNKTHLLCKQVLNLLTSEKTETKKVKVGWLRTEDKTWTTYNCRITYIDMLGNKATFDWYSTNENDVDTAFKDISAQVSAQQQDLNEKVVDKAVDAILLGDNKDVNRNR